MFGGPKKCFKCEKQVYPVEELKCLDKTWHRQCFKCTICGMVLNMKNYKGFDKQPYCQTHYPQQKPTVLADNPEMQRVKENTKIQSQAKYHEDFEKSKGTYTFIADDPDTKRVMENSKIISQVKYHENFEKTKNKYTPVVDTPENTRAIENQKIISAVEYKNHSRNSLRSDSSSHLSSNEHIPSRLPPNTVTYRAGEKQISNDSLSSTRKIGSIHDYDPSDYEKVYTKEKSIHQKHIPNYKNYGVINLQNDLSDDVGVNVFKQNQSTTVYRAIYDHDAKEDDEISFRDGDIFLDCQIIDPGWMVGKHEKSGKYGLFPSNYAEPMETF